MRIRTLIHLALVFFLFGCGGLFVPDARPTTGRLPELAEVPDPEETVRGGNDPAIVTLPIGKALRGRRLSRIDKLPANIIIPTTNLSTVPVTAALQAVLDGTDVSLSWESGEFDKRLVTVTNLSGALPMVVEKICRSAKIFCGYRNGLLEMKEKESFIIELPVAPIKTATGTESTAAASNTMADTISMLAGDKARVDGQGGNLIYTADVESHEQIQEYLTQLRHGRPLVVMKLYIWEVTLNKDNATGINWTSFSMGKIKALGQDILLSGSTAFTSLKTPGVSLGATTSGVVDAESVLKFLSSKGMVQTISNPQLTFVSGSSSEFRVGGQRRYISQVGELSSSVSGSSSSGLGSNTISTDSIDTGLTVQVSGSYENGVISSYLTVELQDIISLNPTTTTQGVTIDLPETSERKVETTLRVRPGDNLVLAGLVTSRDENTREGMPTLVGDIPSYRSDTLKNTELVLLVKPSVVMFADTKEDPKKKAAQSGDGAYTPKGKYILDALVIDKDGVQKIKIPDVPIDRDEKSSRDSANLPDSYSKKKAPVDQSLLQRGFSHAFESILNGGER